MQLKVARGLGDLSVLSVSSSNRRTQSPSAAITLPGLLVFYEPQCGCHSEVAVPTLRLRVSSLRLPLPWLSFLALLPAPSKLLHHVAAIVRLAAAVAVVW